MSVGGHLGKGLGKHLAPKVAPKLLRTAPGVADSFMRELLHRALHGIGPLKGAAVAAEHELSRHRGRVKPAIEGLIDVHAGYAGAQGFVTNLGGLATAAVAIPANLSGLTVVQCRMVAAIVHLRGYDLADLRVHNAVLVTMLGADSVDKLVKQRRIPAPPMALATAPAHDADLDATISAEVAAELMTAIAGKRIASTLGKRVPVLGGVIGAGTDGLATWRIGEYCYREFLPRARR